MMNFGKLYSEIDKHDIVSFDIFDTLLNRDVCHYKHVFLLVEKELENRGFTNSDFCEKRLAAEYNARRRCTGEVTFEEIYNHFNLSRTSRDIYMQQEISMERALLKINVKIKRIYDYCVKENKTIIIISDMYYSSSFLLSVLKEKGYDRIDRIFVSSEFKQQKRTGRIFPIVLASLGVEGNKIIHIGDNFRSDFLMPKLYGIRAYHYGKKSSCRNFSGEETLNNFINNRLHKINNPYTRFGYKNYGPLLFGFLHHLTEEVNRRRIERILFCSRDGYVMLKAYKLFETYLEYPVKTSYFYASRRSLQVPLISVQDRGFDLFFEAASFSPYTSMGVVLRRMGIERKLEDADEQKKIEKIKHNVINSDGLKEVRDIILANAKMEKKALDIYLENEGLYSGEKIAFVDVGWKGSLQYSLEQHFNSEDYVVNLTGFYLGLHNETHLDEVCRNSFLFAPGHMKENFYTVMGAMSVIELFFSAPHGSVHCYNTEGVILDGLEYENINEYSYELKMIESLQDGALCFIKDYLESPLPKEMIGVEVAFQNLKELMVKPEKLELEIFGRFKFDGASGLAPIVDWKGWNHYIKRSKEFLVDFSQSGWKVGFIIKAFGCQRMAYSVFKTLYRLKKE